MICDCDKANTRNDAHCQDIVTNSTTMRYIANRFVCPDGTARRTDALITEGEGILLDNGAAPNYIGVMKSPRTQIKTLSTPNPRAVIGQIASIRELANRFIEHELARRGIAGIVPAHGAVLSFLFAQSAPVPIRDIVRHVGRVKSTVTQVIAGLERAGYITKTASADDCRVVLVALTEPGHALREAFADISAALEAKVYGDMPLEERRQLMMSLSRLEVNLRR